MGLACSQIRLLTLTARKADCERGLAIDAMKKMSLTRESTELTQEYRNKLQAKQISFYANGQYNKMNYGYLMGYGSDYLSIWNGSKPLKTDNSMILSDYKGQVVLSDAYANAITSVLGSSVMNSKGEGSTFSTDKIAEIIAALCPTLGYDADTYQAIIDNKNVQTSYGATSVNTRTGESTGKTKTVDSSSSTTEKLKALVDFYYPIFQAAAVNGWTTEYNKDMATNDNYVSDALVSGTFQLESVSGYGEYDEGTSLTYFVTNGAVQSRTDSDVREEITAWYNAEKEAISEKESYIDLHTKDLSTELEAINTEIQSIKSLIDDAISSVFDWGSS